MEGLKFYRCNECGNLMLTLVDSSVIPNCCDASMEELISNRGGEGGEKHIPMIDVTGDKAEVRVGFDTHPMLAEHRVEWIILVDGPRVDIQRLKLTAEPVADFTLRYKTEKLRAYAFCNIHGLWESEE